MILKRFIILFIIIFINTSTSFGQDKKSEDNNKDTSALETKKKEASQLDDPINSENEKELPNVANSVNSQQDVPKYSQQMINETQYQFDKTPDPAGYDISKRGFPKGQDIFLLRGKSMSEIWIKAKGWVKSAALMAEINGQIVPLKAMDDFNLQADNGLEIGSTLEGGNFIATSARSKLVATGTVLKLLLPAVVSYGSEVAKSANLITAFEHVFIRLYSEPYGRGNFKDIEYFLKTKLQLNNKESLKKIKVTHKKEQEVVRYEYRSITLNIDSIQLREDDQLIYSILSKDLVNNEIDKSNNDGIKLVKWGLDKDRFESVLIFDVYLHKNSDRRFIEVSMMVEGLKTQAIHHTVKKMIRPKPIRKALIIPR